MFQNIFLLTQVCSTRAGRYYFDGVDISDFINDSTNNVDGVLDSLGNAYEAKENSNAYTTNLPTHIYQGSNYTINEKSTASAMLHATFFKKTLQPTFTLGYNLKVGNHLSVAANYSIINKIFDNIGLGLSTNAGPVQ